MRTLLCLQNKNWSQCKWNSEFFVRCGICRVSRHKTTSLSQTNFAQKLYSYLKTLHFTPQSGNSWEFPEQNLHVCIYYCYFSLGPSDVTLPIDANRCLSHTYVLSPPIHQLTYAFMKYALTASFIGSFALTFVWTVLTLTPLHMSSSTLSHFEACHS